MSDKCFFDSNILVYMQDSNDSRKQEKSRCVFFDCISKGTAFISTQSLQEFYNVTTKKKRLDRQKAKEIVHWLSISVSVVQITPASIEQAIDISIETQFSFWDSLIVSAAVSAGCSVLYSEDLNDGQTVRGVTIRNPFEV